VIQDAFPADASQLGQLLTLSAQTLAMSILASAGAGLVAFAFLPANNFCCREDSGHWWQQASVRNSCSGIHPISACPACRPEPIWALIFLFVLFPGFYQSRLLYTT